MLPRGEERVDGRRLRAQRTRRAIVAAAIELIDGGEVDPTGQQIAARAKVAVRSIGQHFASREELLLAAAEEHAARMAAMRAAIGADAPWGERFSAFVVSRAKELDASAAMRRAAAAHEARSKVVEGAIVAAARARRVEVTRVFGAELGALSPAERRAVADALDAATSGKTWDGMRRDAGLGHAHAKAAMARTIAALLRGRAASGE